MHRSTVRAAIGLIIIAIGVAIIAFAPVLASAKTDMACKEQDRECRALKATSEQVAPDHSQVFPALTPDDCECRCGGGGCN